MARIGDRTKRWTILLPTALLPRPARVATRRYLLSRLELGRARRARLILIGHPKSGNTWLRTMLSRLYQVRHGMPSDFVMKSDELAQRNREIPRILATNGYYSYEGIVGDDLDASATDSELRAKSVVFLARHPCDIAVSWYFQFTKRQSAYKQELINAFIEHPIDRDSVELWDFVRHSDIGLPFLIDYLNTWERNVARIPGALTLRYEDLRAEPARWLKRITELMGESFSDQEIGDAVSFASFDNLRRLEAGGQFRGGGLSRQDRSDPTTFKVRRGKVGGYRDYFSPEQLQELEELVRDRLSPSLGYGETSAAAQTVAAPRGNQLPSTAPS